MALGPHLHASALCRSNVMPTLYRLNAGKLHQGRTATCQDHMLSASK